MSHWRVGVIHATYEGGIKALPGWISEPFGIDWGVHKDSGEICWVVHHLPTGFNILAMFDEVGVVMKLVDLLRTMGDWDFTDRAGVSSYADALRVARASGFQVYSPKCIGRPAYPDEIEVAA